MKNNSGKHDGKILVADDNIGLLSLIQKALVNEGLETETVLSGTEAVERVLSVQPLLILLDYCLPDMNGDQVIKSLIEKKVRVPFIVITGQGDENVAVQMMKLGATDYLVKDTSFLDLLPSVVTKALNSIETENKLVEAEKELRKKDEQVRKLSLAVEQSPVSIVITNIKGKIEYVNPKFSEVTGYQAHEVLGQNPSIVKSGEHSTVFYKQLWDSITTGNEWNGEFHNRKKNGELYWENATVSPIMDAKGTITHFVAVKEDITDRKIVEKDLMMHQEHLMELVEDRTSELQRSYESLERETHERRHAEKQVRLMALFAELSPSPVLRFDFNGKVLMANSAAIETFDLDSSDETPLVSLLPGIEELDLDSCIRNGTVLHCSKQIGGRFFHLTFIGVPDLKVGQMYGIDITEQKKAEAESLRASHLASLGELAAGVAHEINNPINGIINYTQILANKTAPESKEHDIMRRIIKEGDRIAGIIRSLLSFASDTKEEKHPVCLHEIMSDSLALTKAQLEKDGIHLKISIPLDLPKIIAQPQQIEQVFLNIISNARYALNRKYPGPDKNKRLEVEVRMLFLDDCPFVQILFHDQGIGIPEEIIDKIMDPFVTTKPSDIGTGLGLSISHGIISDHGGRIELTSINKEFTKIIITLPAHMEGPCNET